MNDRPLSAAAVARQILGRSPSWFYSHRADLEAAGFPKPLPVLNRYDPAAVKAWLHGKADNDDDRDGAILEGLCGDAA